MLKIEKYSEAISKIENKVKQVFVNSGIEYKVVDDDKNTIKLVFAGQYSAGKSSILRLLTGRDDIAIGAGITT